MTEMSLVRYLVSELMLSDEDRVDALRDFVPTAVDSDWETNTAGQRVQIIQPEKGGKGKLAFDTTVLGSATAASPGCWAPHRAHRRRSRHAQGARAVLFRPIRVVASEAEGHGAVIGHEVVR